MEELNAGKNKTWVTRVTGPWLLLPLEPSISWPISKSGVGSVAPPLHPPPPHTHWHEFLSNSQTPHTTAHSPLLPTLNLCLSRFEIYWKIQMTGSELILWPLWRLAQENWCVSQLWVRQNVWSPLSGNLLKITKGVALEKNVILRTLGTGMGRFKVSPMDVLDLNILARGSTAVLSLVHWWIDGCSFSLGGLCVVF